jgi:ABC-type Na+ transport system ATPase subunit NatA
MENSAEIWKDIIGFEGLYQISNYGNVKSCKRYVNAKFGKRVVNEKLLSLGKDKDGYLMAILCQDGIKKTVKIHRLVANAFIDKFDGKDIVNHIDSNKSNNNLSNLEWVSSLENSCHSRLKMKTSSKYVGVCFHKKDNRFRATATINGKNINLGRFKNEEDAYNLRRKFLKENNIDSKYL